MAEELSKSTEFFLQPNFMQQIENEALLYGHSLPELDLEVQGYGSFYQIDLQERFVRALEQYLRVFPQVKFLRIQMAGFKEAQQGPNHTTVVSRICQVVAGSRSINRLHLNFPNYLSGTVSDFRNLIHLIIMPDLKLEEVQLNLANWQLNLDLPTMENSLRPLVESINFVHFDQLRLQFSGWYYKNYHALFGGEPPQREMPNQAERKQVQKELEKVHKENVGKLHETVRGLVQALFPLTKDVLVIDFRKYSIEQSSWNQALEMKQLKKTVDNLTKAGSYEKSLVHHHSKPLEETIKEFKFTFLV